MSAPQRVPNGARVLLLALIAIPLAVGCGVERQPTGYGDDYRDNFMIGCTGADPDGEPVKSDQAPDGVKLASKSDCECIYEGLEETVPFEDAKTFEEAQAEAEDGADIEVPKNIQSVFDGCSDS